MRRKSILVVLILVFVTLVGSVSNFSLSDDEKKYKRIILNNPNNLEVRFSLLEIYEDEGDNEKAIECLEDILWIDEDNEEAYLRLAELLIEDGNELEAIDVLERGTELAKSAKNDNALEVSKPLKPELIINPSGNGNDRKIALKSEEDIYFTLDGSNPDQNSEKYNQIIDLEIGKTILKAVVIDSEGRKSNIFSKEFVINKSDRIELKDEDKRINFKDKNFEKEIREIYMLEDKKNIKWKDIGYRKNLYLKDDFVIKTVEDLKWFVNLKELDISGEVKGDISNLSGLKKLIYLDLSDTLLEGNIKDLGELNNLKGLFLSNASVTGDTSSLASFKSLEDLFINNVLITGDIKELSQLKNLNKLCLNSTLIKGDISSLNELKNLYGLSLGKISPRLNIEKLDKLTNLYSLELDNIGSKVNIDNINKLSNLEFLEFKNIGLIGDINNLEKLEKLKVLELSNMNFNICNLSELDQITDLYLRGKLIYGDISYLDDFKNLTCIWLRKTSINGSIDSLSKLERLEDLSLDGNLLKGNISILRSLTNLEYIELKNTQISGDIGSLSELENLKKLELENTSCRGNLQLTNGDLIDVK